MEQKKPNVIVFLKDGKSIGAYYVYAEAIV